MDYAYENNFKPLVLGHLFWPLFTIHRDFSTYDSLKAIIEDVSVS